MKAVGTIYVAEEGDEFKLLEGNRKIDRRRVDNVSASFSKIGFLPSSPIVVNEDMQIIEGQARYTAAKEGGYPIYFAIEPSAGLRECIAMNSGTANWTLIDYIHSYAAQGNAEYIKLQKYIDKYRLPLTLMLSLCTGFLSDGGYISDRVKSGEFRFAVDETEEELIELLDFLTSANEHTGAISGSHTRLMKAIAFCYRVKETDRERLAKVIERIADIAKREYIDVTTIRRAVLLIESRYNSRLSDSKKIHYTWLYDGEVNKRKVEANRRSRERLAQ